MFPGQGPPDAGASGPLRFLKIVQAGFSPVSGIACRQRRGGPGRFPCPRSAGGGSEADSSDGRLVPAPRWATAGLARRGGVHVQALRVLPQAHVRPAGRGLAPHGRARSGQGCSRAGPLVPTLPAVPDWLAGPGLSLLRRDLHQALQARAWLDAGLAGASASPRFALPARLVRALTGPACLHGTGLGGRSHGMLWACWRDCLPTRALAGRPGARRPRRMCVKQRRNMP